LRNNMTYLAAAGCSVDDSFITITPLRAGGLDTGVSDTSLDLDAEADGRIISPGFTGV